MSTVVEHIAAHIAAASLIHGWEKDDECYRKFEEWYYESIDRLFGKVNAGLASFDLPCEISIEYDEQFENCRDEMDGDLGDAIGIAVFSNQVDAHVLPVAVDPEKVYIEFVSFESGHIAKERAENEIEITLWHEAGHAIVGMLRQQFEYDVMAENGWTDEEEIAEEFGQAKGSLNGSRLGKWILGQSADGWEEFLSEE